MEDGQVAFDSYDKQIADGHYWEEYVAESHDFALEVGVYDINEVGGDDQWEGNQSAQQAHNY